MLRSTLARLAQGLIVLAVPVCLLVAGFRLATGHWFVRWEYGKADFPPDPLGLPVEERARLAEVCVDYLRTDAEIELLADLRLPGGAPAFDERELQHMVDVQGVYRRVTWGGLAAALLLIASAAALFSSQGERSRVPAGLLGGSLLTLGLLGAVGAYMALAWSSFFTNFHRLFFQDGTWTFAATDTLIRLFPMRFWIDVALVVVGFLVLGALLVGLVGWAWRRRVRRAGA